MPTIIATETWTGTTGALWPAQWTTGGYTDPTISANQGKLSASTAQNYRNAWAYGSGMPATINSDITVTFIASDAGEQKITIGSRVTSATEALEDGSGPLYGVSAKISTDASLVSISTNNGTGIVDIGTAAFTLSANVSYKFRFQTLGATLSAKIWQASGAEPAAWTVSATSVTIAMGAGRAWLGYRGGADLTARFILLDNFVETDAGVDLPWFGA